MRVNNLLTVLPGNAPAGSRTPISRSQTSDALTTTALSTDYGFSFLAPEVFLTLNDAKFVFGQDSTPDPAINDG